MARAEALLDGCGDTGSMKGICRWQTYEPLLLALVFQKKLLDFPRRSVEELQPGSIAATGRQMVCSQQFLRIDIGIEEKVVVPRLTRRRQRFA